MLGPPLFSSGKDFHELAVAPLAATEYAVSCHFRSSAVPKIE
jgi:hypothetical protein